MSNSPRRRKNDSRLAASTDADPVGVVCAVLNIFFVILFARAVFSWFPVRPGSGAAQINRVLMDLTEWALRPLRRVIPPAGMFDLSFLVLVVFLFIARTALGC
jgi:YggT family protein